MVEWVYGVSADGLGASLFELKNLGLETRHEFRFKVADLISLHMLIPDSFGVLHYDYDPLTDTVVITATDGLISQARMLVGIRYDPTDKHLLPGDLWYDGPETAGVLHGFTTVGQVPLPSAALLFSGGLAYLVNLRRRRL